MSDFQVHIAAPRAAEELNQLVDQLGTSIERAVGDAGKVTRQKAQMNENDFSQDIVISTDKGQLEVAVSWARDAARADVSVMRGSSGGIVAYLPMVLALAVGFWADQSPELLPVFRGIRVALGALVGLVAGFLIAGLVRGAKAKTSGFDRELEQRIQGAVRGVVLGRAATVDSP